MRTILVSVLGACFLMACGQKGPLALPTGEAAAGRATLTETLRPDTTQAPSPAQPASAPPTGTASPVRLP